VIAFEFQSLKVITKGGVMKIERKRLSKQHIAIEVSGNAKKVSLLTDKINANRDGYRLDHSDGFERDGLRVEEFVCHRKHSRRAIEFVRKMAGK
tara:strand:- start:4734 stop:5015 length:282 start_codon:yes stop_codon:yes gene_type:complete